MKDPRRVVGTPVVSANDDDRARTILVSDLHIPATGGVARRRLLDLLAGLDQPTRTRVIVLGDLFDSYIGARQNAAAGWHEIIEVLAAAAERGVSLTVLHGNRDYMLDAAFAGSARCRVVAGGLQIRLGERRCLLLHGDELCQRDLPYQRAKRWLRHPLTRVLLRGLPLFVTLRLAARARNRSAEVIATGDQTRFDPTAAALEEVFAGPVEVLVFGHIHRPARGQFGRNGGEYAILPAFDATGVYLDHRDGELRYCRVGGELVDDYPPREFC